MFLKEDGMKILYVDCCISQKSSGSRTSRLCNAFLDGAKKSNPGLETEHLDLKNMVLSPFTVPMLNERDALSQEGKFDDEIFALARQFRDADGIVVGALFWDLIFPAQLRIYLEHIFANGVTYFYDDKGPHGKCKARWLVYLTSGGDFAQEFSIGIEYWKQVSQMFGIRKFYDLFADGLDADPEHMQKYLDAACKKAADLASKLAKKE